jgi:hypothetical protein
MTRVTRSLFTSPLVGEVDRRSQAKAVGRGVSGELGLSGLPPSLALPRKGGGNPLVCVEALQ